MDIPRLDTTEPNLQPYFGLRARAMTAQGPPPPTKVDGRHSQEQRLASVSSTIPYLKVGLLKLKGTHRQGRADGHTYAGPDGHIKTDGRTYTQGRTVGPTGTGGQTDGHTGTQGRTDGRKHRQGLTGGHT
ncbi:hypothetical protein ElyMa_005019200 [Elysia marginata]|uniref:Uncharacterized protein n=1 Tax=Elysia marginata TaxID=1093978 RepID=A0AAV4J9G5_9GAST|nr:hypothetical protein ElyMa_005019200 [Elysia marginata]